MASGPQYGTLIVNLDTHRLWCYCQAEQRTLAAWFKKYPKYRLFHEIVADLCVSCSRWCTAGNTGGRSLASAEEYW
jgi:hypothetical protein